MFRGSRLLGLFVSGISAMIRGGGRNLLTDGDMEGAGTAAWTPATATLSKETSTPHGGERCLRVAYLATAQGGATQYALTNGATYRATGFARSNGSAIPRVGTSAATLWTGINGTTDWQLFDVTFTVTTIGPVMWFFSANLAAGRYVDFDDVMLRRIA